MAIVLSGATSTIAPITVQDVLDCVTQEVQNRFPHQSTLIEYVDRIHKMIVRRKKWNWLLSDPKLFITRTGQTDYWLGATGGQSLGQTDTGLNLTDIYELKGGFVLSPSGWTELARTAEVPSSIQWRNPDGSFRMSQPAEYRSDPGSPNVLTIYPAPDKGQGYLLVPEPPRVTTSVAGALAARIEFYRVSFVDGLGNEGATSQISTRVFIPANSVAVVQPPQPAISESGSGVPYNQYNVYASTVEGSETLQNGSPISTATAWTEDVGGLTTTGVSASINSAIEPLDGYVLQFRYNRLLTTLTATTDQLLVPARYADVVCAGVNWLGTQHDRKQGQVGAESAGMWEGVFREGLAQMVLEQNPWSTADRYIQPDPNSARQPFLRGSRTVTQP